ncbi:hypothetical protein [Xaviernesmea oryzae]|uniref:hypothetical protein n=1 Tax=Xaviernesmea oryzae TaxID=464029 RepID=UPI001F3593E2|nr:hypothetical protein [Xaviernesmea oryzae]
MPFIVACDIGADPGYDMVDVLRLIQRARIDLGAEITFLDQAQITAKIGCCSPLARVLGPYAELARSGSFDKPGGPAATLAAIRYNNGTQGTLLLIKPRLSFTEPPELLAYYHRPGSGTFPQQTTGDQFFDEEQWEAYRHLGEYYRAAVYGARSQSRRLVSGRYEALDVLSQASMGQLKICVPHQRERLIAAKRDVENEPNRAALRTSRELFDKLCQFWLMFSCYGESNGDDERISSGRDERLGRGASKDRAIFQRQRLCTRSDPERPSSQ